MGLKIADARPLSLPKPNNAPTHASTRFAAEYRTLSIQVGDAENGLSKGSKALRSFLAWPRWREILNEIVPLRSAHEQHETDEHQRNEALSKVASQLRNLSYHKDSVGEVYARFNTSPGLGLESQAITLLHARYGYNTVRPPSRMAFARVIGWFFGGFNRFLWLAMIVFWLCWKPIGNPPQSGNLALAVVIIFVICLQATFSAWQEWITSRAMHSITNMVPIETTVLRDGVIMKISPKELVPGDVVYLQAGDRAPADLRLVNVSMDLLLDRSALSGFPEPTIGAVDHTSSNYLETRNILMMGANVVQGHVQGIVVATGGETVLGRISKLNTNKLPNRTILQLEVHRLVNGLTTLSLVVGTIFIILWAVWLRNSFPGFMAVSDALANGVGVLVTFVPGGLPISLTLALTAIAKRMQRHKVLIKNLTTVETLGTVNAICCEKTGTLTQRRMIVTKVAYANTETPMEHLAYEAKTTVDSNTRRPHGSPRRGMAALKYLPPATKRLFETALLCNGASFDPLTSHMPIHERITIGDATDCALLRMAEEIFPTGDALPAYSTLTTIPFNLRNRWMLSVCFNQLDENAGPFVVVKGAPERLLPKCTSIQADDGQILALDRSKRRNIKEIQRRWAAEEGCRVLLLCRRDFTLPSEKGWDGDDIAHRDEINPFWGIEDSPSLMYSAATESMHNLCVVGLVGMVDPPRVEIPEVVSTFRKAGIRVLMVTGDYAPTAAHVARQCRIITRNYVDGINEVLARADQIPYSTKELLDGTQIDSLPLENSGRMQASNPLNNHGELRLDSCEYDDVSLSRRESAVDSQRTLENKSALVISGPELHELQKEHWDVITSYEEIVFARITPEQKLQVVEELRARDNYVAVTGDDVNDLPAMRAAHVGVAMGNGSEVAKEAAEMVLLDNNFASMVVAIESGRLVFINLKKVIIYLLPMTNMSEIMPSLLNVVLGLPIPLSTFLMLVINTISDVWASIVLIEEEPEDDIMLNPPRNPRKEGLVNVRFFLQAYGFIGLIQTVTGHIAFFLCMYMKGGIRPGHIFLAFNKWTDGYLGKSKSELAYLVNMSGSSHYMALVIMQWGNMFVARTRKLSVFQQNPFWGPKRNIKLLVAIPISIGVALFVNEIPWFNSVFLTGKIPVEFFFIPIPFAFFLIACDETRKFLVRRYPASIFAKLAW
ncbi:hypothetical protein GGI25_004320 [Coemansia spiralis]|uniref:Cation-transporting P-type ATPase N-terminal domain-containing protein n=2 Tax=Coemansia TaxID=4863 RepID=A0A9W8G0M3_9FUNG|nr:hypothetical protein EDC05_003826 [Coemansia umbellata]KAJ2622633.1 hypothetical protein GGI26_003079 [Coemansia sp. RSA 1358]KAJ2674581.1 hypothetical protein GGI25_004320 [Coemansia spiralis]